MGPKPRQTIPRPVAASSSAAVPAVGVGGGTVRVRRWVYKRASLVLLLLLQGGCLVLGFVLLTEPCLNAQYKNSLWDKRNYLSLLARDDVGKERFLAAGVKSLFGTLVIQAWFTARLNAYTQGATHHHQQLVEGLKGNKDKVRVEFQVPSFIRQLEAVSASLLLSLPLTALAIYALLLVGGASLTSHWKESATLATHLALLLLPPIHIAAPNPGFVQKLLAANPSPSFLWPLFYPPLFSIATTLLATATLALDSDSPWQTYPFPLIVAGIAGIAVGNVYTIALILFT